LTPEHFPSDKLLSGMLDSEVIEDTGKIVNEAIKDRLQTYLIINNRAEGSEIPFETFLVPENNLSLKK
jgi:hypothetical protein